MMDSFIAWDVFILSEQRKKLKSHEEVCKDKKFCEVLNPSEKNNILEFSQYMKSYKMPYFFYVDIEFWIKRMERCTNNPEKSQTSKLGEHILCGYST